LPYLRPGIILPRYRSIGLTSARRTTPSTGRAPTRSSLIPPPTVSACPERSTSRPNGRSRSGRSSCSASLDGLIASWDRPLREGCTDDRRLRRAAVDAGLHPLCPRSSAANICAGSRCSFGEFNDAQWRALQGTLLAQRLLERPTDLPKAVDYDFLRKAYPSPWHSDAAATSSDRRYPARLPRNVAGRCCMVAMLASALDNLPIRNPFIAELTSEG
jgi:hypothetical protein